MTIKAYLDLHRNFNLQNTDSAGPKWIDVIQESTSIWSNNACKGYVILALNMLSSSHKLDDNFIQNVLYKLSLVFDNVSEEEAEKYYENSQWRKERK